MRNNYGDLEAQPDFIHKLNAASDTAAVATKAADPDQFWVVDWVGWSYDDEPTGGKLTIAFGSTTLVELDIVAAGPGQLDFDKPLYNPSQTKNEALTITLSAGGTDVTGKVFARVR